MKEKRKRVRNGGDEIRGTPIISLPLSPYVFVQEKCDVGETEAAPMQMSVW